MDVVAIILQGQLPNHPGVLSHLSSLWFRAVLNFVVTLVVGAVLLTLVPEYVEGVIETVQWNTGRSFFWGLCLFVGFSVAILFFLITLSGILIAIPLLFVETVLYMVGGVIVFLMVGERLLARRTAASSRWIHLVVGSVVSGVIAGLPGVGLLFSTIVNFLGAGGIVYWWDRNKAVEYQRNGR